MSIYSNRQHNCACVRSLKLYYSSTVSSKKNIRNAIPGLWICFLIMWNKNGDDEHVGVNDEVVITNGVLV